MPTPYTFNVKYGQF